MKITHKIILELKRIHVNENPIHKRGKYIEYVFNMTYPSSHYLFTKPKVGEKNFSIFSGHSPTVHFYNKDFKPLEQQILSLIEQDIPIENANIDNWWLAKKYEGNWGLFYHASTYHNKERVQQKCERRIDLSDNFMSRIIAEIPIRDDFNGKIE